MRVDIFMKKLNPSFIPKFKNELEKLPVFAPSFFKKEDKMNHVILGIKKNIKHIFN